METKSHQGDEPYVQMNSGNKIYLNDLSNNRYFISDIAHSLANCCRYNGHSDIFYCPTPDQKILTSDLYWVNAGDLKVGTNLVGFDETLIESGAAGNERRKFRPSVVKAHGYTRLHTYTLEMSDGSIIKSSDEHPWLIRSKKSGNQKWRTTADIVNRTLKGNTVYINKFMDVWETQTDRDSGWLAGIYDGEGSLSFSNRTGVLLSVAQKQGIVLDKILKTMDDRGYKYGYYNNDNGVVNIQVRGGWREFLKFIGSIRPERLINKFEAGLKDGRFNKQLDSLNSPLSIVKVYDNGIQDVVMLETSTKTYLCEGFCSHNSVAQHSVLASHMAPKEIALEVLMHDCAESILTDLPRPVKYFIPGVKEFESRIEQDMFKKLFLTWPLTDEIYYIDNCMLATEARQIMSKSNINEWGYIGTLPSYNIKIDSWRPEHAKQLFLDRYSYLSERRAVAAINKEADEMELI